MQLKQSIIDTFSRKGYFLHSTMTRRQFHILMNTFITQSNTHPHWLFDENLTSELWRQAQQRTPITNPNASQPQLSNPNPNLRQLTVQSLVVTIIDAIQILTNRILECEERIQELKQKRQQLELEQQFSKLQSIKTKIQTINTDLRQFEKDFKLLSQPFLSQGSKQDFKRKQSLRRHDTRGDRPFVLQMKKPNTLMSIENHYEAFEEKIHQRFESPLSSNATSRALRKTPYQEQKNCALYFLIFLSILELSVCLIKFNFVNLLVELLGFLVLLEDRHLPSMLKITFYACLTSVVLDSGWLFLYSRTYLHSYFNSGLKHQLKPYLQYVWFATVLQLFVKLIFLYFIRAFDVKSQAFVKAKQFEGPIFTDKYIPQLKQISKDTPVNKNNKKRREFMQAQEKQETIVI